MEKNSIVSSYMGVNTIPDVGISLVTVGKKDLRNQNERTESLCIVWFNVVGLLHQTLFLH